MRRDPRTRQGMVEAERKWRAANPDKMHAKQSRSYLRNSESRRAGVKKYREENPDIARAHDIVERAVKFGKIVRRPCEICGAVRTDAHHDDYTKPLEVRWLCRRCHKLHHLKLEAAANG
jgi:ribosomal protein S27AE